MSQAHVNFAAAVGMDGRIYAFGGFDGTGTRSDVVEAYDPSTNTWGSVAPLPTPNSCHAAATGQDGRIYVMGGITLAGAAYDPPSDTWEPIASIPSERCGLAAVAGSDGRIYAIGGSASSGVVLAYDPSSDTWTTGAPMPTPRRYLAAVAGADGRIYAIGGYNAGSCPNGLCDVVEAYDPDLDSWTTVAPMPTDRYGLAAALGLDGAIYAMGGFGGDNGYTDVVEVYEPSSDTWASAAQLPELRFALAAATGPDGIIYAMGGFDGSDGLYESSVFAYGAAPPPDPDADGDGIDDVVDTAPTIASTQFLDGTTTPPTNGEIVDRNGLTVTVQDAADPADGVRVIVTGTGSQKATFRICGFTVRLRSGSDSTFTCGSVIVGVAAGDAEIDLGDGSLVTIPSGGLAEVIETDTDVFSVQNLGTTDVHLSIDGVSAEVPAGQTQQVTSWQFQGFASPVDNPAVLNVLSAGQAVPLRWRLLGSDGAPVTDLTTVSLSITSLSCADGTTADLVEEAAAGSSGLQNLGDGYYQLNWKTPKSYSQSCKTLHLDLGEGVSRDALFRFPR